MCYTEVKRSTFPKGSIDATLSIKYNVSIRSYSRQGVVLSADAGASLVCNQATTYRHKARENTCQVPPEGLIESIYV